MLPGLQGRYRIEREVGEGGMATVYLAKDLKHNRNVALKVLKPELAAVVGAERFLAEIETTAPCGPVVAGRGSGARQHAPDLYRGGAGVRRVQPLGTRGGPLRASDPGPELRDGTLESVDAPRGFSRKGVLP